MEMAWSTPGFGLITSRAAKNKDRWKAQNRGRMMGLISPMGIASEGESQRGRGDSDLLHLRGLSTMRHAE
ncbi:MAG: hypothetical protein CME50_01685 [Halieaceae bacterium]|nr:hypothetical protein [Halieaceae bacterium]